MRRLAVLALALAVSWALSACGGHAPAEEPLPPGPAPPAGSAGSVLYDACGLEVALPLEYDGLLYVETGFPDAAESWRPLISVYEKASYEAAMEEYGGGGGFLFGLLMMDQAAFEQHISTNAAGVDVFATDGERYFAYTYPTDVQFCRPGGEIDIQSEDWAVWEELNEIGPQVREDFLERNGLQSFTTQDFMEHLTAEDGDHVCVRYYPYYGQEADTRVYHQLLLRQPARQGEGGIWAVDQWLDVFGEQHLYFPDSGRPAAEYYAQLQEACDAGERPELLIPAGAAMVFAQEYFGREATGQGTVCEEAGGVDRAYMERNRRLVDLWLDLESRPEEVDEMELLACVGEATADNWGVLGRYGYGSDWFGPLMDAVSDASIGEGQQERDRAVLAFYLATEGAATDFHGPLSGILRSQENMDPEAYQAALDSFPEEDRALLLGARFGVSSAPIGSDLPELVDAPAW